MTPLGRATFVTAAAGATATVAAIFTVHDWVAAAPLLVAYAVLLWNTFLSIRFFGNIIPDVPPQQLINGALFALYLLLGALISNTLAFAAVLAALLSIATLKYVFFIPLHPALLRRKIFADGIGAVAALCALFGIASGYPFLTSVIGAAFFVAAHLYLAFIRPLYALPADH
jgi:hypothetical protein